MFRTILLVGIGGGIGSAFRYLTSVVAGKYFPGSFSLATFLTNFIGCFLIGLLMGYFLKNHMEESPMRWFLVAGFCGGYTTFSAFAYENIALLQAQNYLTAFSYIILSVVVGLAAVWCGLVLSR